MLRITLHVKTGRKTCRPYLATWCIFLGFPPYFNTERSLQHAPVFSNDCSTSHHAQIFSNNSHHAPIFLTTGYECSSSLHHAVNDGAYIFSNNCSTSSNLVLQASQPALHNCTSFEHSISTSLSMNTSIGHMCLGMASNASVSTKKKSVRWNDKVILI